MESTPPPDTPMAETRSGPATPVRPGERVEILDILRGFAIFGILLVNVAFFFAPIYLQPSGVEWWPSRPDRIAEGLIVFFAQGKFYALFSFLFGMGLAIQMERAAARGRPVAGFFARRMFWLLLIGLGHAWLLWYGDILALYALLGFLLILFRNRKPKTLLVWTIVLFAIPVLLNAAFVVALELGRAMPEVATTIDEMFEQNRVQSVEMLEEARRAYATGSYGEIFRTRFGEWIRLFSVGLLFVGPQLLGLFLIGLNLGRRRFFQNLPQHRDRIRRWIWIFLAVGLIGSTCLLIGNEVGDPAEPSWFSLLSALGQILGAPALSAFYVSAIALLLERERWHRLLSPMGCVGRMALSNYLLHTVVFTTVAYSYGLGLYGRVGPALGLLLTFAMFLVQIPLSRWWLSRYRFGPLEWLWRSLTYLKPQPLRRDDGQPAPDSPGSL